MPQKQTISNQVETILKPLFARRDELAAERSRIQGLRTEAGAMKKEADELARRFERDFDTAERESAIEAVSNGSKNPRDLIIRNREQEVAALRSRADIALVAVQRMVAQLESDEQTLLDEANQRLLGVVHGLTGGLAGALFGVAGALKEIGEFQDALSASAIRGLRCPISPGLFVPMRPDEESPARRWLQANVEYGYAKPEVLKAA